VDGGDLPDQGQADAAALSFGGEKRHENFFALFGLK
jgi:hypothetical protein